MKNILLPTDFSVNSKNAIQYALNFFQGTSISFYFLNVQKTSDFVLDDVMTASMDSSVYQAILKDNKQQLQEFIAPFKEQFKEEAFEFKLYVDYDNLTDSIQQLIEAEQIDLIIMGTNGATGASEKLFGSNTLNVIRKIDCPILAVPENYSFKKIESIVFTTDSCKDMRHNRTQPLKDLIDLTKAKLHILKIKEVTKAVAPEHDCASCLVESLNGYDYTSHTLRGIPEPIAIDAFVQLMKSDLHALFIERETFLDRFFFGTSTAKISYGTRVPLLVLHKK